MSRDELIVVVCRQAVRITAQAGRLAELVEADEALAGKPARVEHLLSRNSGNSSSPPSKDDDPGRAPPPDKRRGGGATRSRGKQPGAPGSHPAWTDAPDDRQDRFPQGSCGCGADLGGARDLGVVDRYRQHEIPQPAVQVIEYDAHQVECGCGAVHTAARPEGARSGQVGYGPSLAVFAVYLMVVQFLPAHRVVALLESLTGAAPSVGSCTACSPAPPGSWAWCTTGSAPWSPRRMRCAAMRPHCGWGRAPPSRVGRKPSGTCWCSPTRLYTHYLLGDRSLATFKESVLTELGARADGSAIIVHDRYQNYDNPALGTLAHQLCTQHLLRDLDGAAQVYPDAIWPIQIADALRGLIHKTNLSRDHGLPAIAADTKTAHRDHFHHGVLVGLSDTLHHDTRPAQNKARNLLEGLRDRPGDVLRFADDLTVPPTSNQAERDLRPSKVQQNTSGRLTSEARTRDRYTIRGYVSTAIKHGHDAITALHDALTGHPWMPALPAPT